MREDPRLPWNPILSKDQFAPDSMMGMANLGAKDLVTAGEEVNLDDDSPEEFIAGPGGKNIWSTLNAGSDLIDRGYMFGNLALDAERRARRMWEG